ncbi:class I SAM-dependent methyltransferase [Roseibacillus persicicus]|uniref:SAM-dependent methyltransferase n=1 Tax=Roseibacillus persicicus TaxID=454148 RepID=A0A918TUA4_9BACT|nr:class I SAM-dependent methyltransferase [Roseibacillus persicicus]GHC63169.1 SAM-dependent methyltransferase [Roseibacillus persicicus]
MRREEITALFDQQAQSYDQQWDRLSALNGALHLLTSTLLAHLPVQARILCVGAGTGAEILHLANTFPEWEFCAVEPSGAMLKSFREKAAEHNILSRCHLHEGYLDTLPPREKFDAATSFLVSQFIPNREERIAFFHAIAEHLLPDGILVTSDLAGDLASPEGQNLTELWFKLMSQAEFSQEGLDRMRQTYQRDVAVLPSGEVELLLTEAGFPKPVRFFQTGLIHAWYSRRLLP